MNARELDRYKRLLLEKQQQLSEEGAEAEAPVPGAGGPQGDLIDQANADSEAELEIRLRRTDGRLLRAIEEALARIRHGTFGVCETCGQRISKARLEAVPWTRLCRECKERQST
jgi:DnaK suppressor protein